MNLDMIPKTDSISELARFWDSHDLTEFEDELEEVQEPVFVREKGSVMHIRLAPEQASALHRIAEGKGVRDAELVQEWVKEKLQAS